MIEKVVDSVVENKQVLINMLERDVGNLYESLRDNIINSFNHQPMIKKVVQNYISANEKRWLEIADEKILTIADLSFIDPDASLEQALINANDYVNTAIGEFLESKLNLPLNSINVGLQALLGIKISS